MTTIIDPDVPSTEYIFRRVFLVATTEEALRAESDPSVYKTTGFAKHDNSLIGMRAQCYMPISRMATIFDKGYMVALVKSEDAKTVYEYIQYHLEGWMKVMTGGLNAVQAPYDDLMVLDRFATAVYGVAAHQYGTPDTQTAFGRFMAQFKHLSADAFNTEVMEAKAPDEPNIKPRIDLQEALLAHQARMLGR